MGKTLAQSALLKSRFLEAFRQTGVILSAAEAAGCARRSIYNWLEHDEEFAAAYRQAEVESTERLEREMIRRAVEGTEKPVFQGGQLVGKIREYSDTLLIFALKARKPHVYRERVEVQHSGEIDRHEKLTDEERAQFRAHILQRDSAQIH